MTDLRMRLQGNHRERMKALQPQVKTIKVWPANDSIRIVMKHAVSGMGFRDGDTPTEWPDDSFTHRRIRDGDVLTQAPRRAAEPAPAEEKKSKDK